MLTITVLSSFLVEFFQLGPTNAMQTISKCDLLACRALAFGSFRMFAENVFRLATCL